MNETQLKIKVLKYLRETYPKSIWFKISDRFTVGIPDIIGCIEKDGRLVGMELKSEKGKSTKMQEYFINKINNAGGIAGVCYSLDDVKKLLTF